MKNSFEKESEIQAYLGKEWNEKDYIYYKMTDGSFGLKPCDCFVCDEYGITHWIELKIVEKMKININKFQLQQLGYLKGVEKNGGSAVVIVYSKQTKKIFVYNFGDFIERQNNIGTITLEGKKAKDRKIKEEKKEYIEIKEKYEGDIPL